MKVAFVIYRFPEVFTTFILHEMTELIKRGHDVLVLTVSNKYNPTVHEDVIRYGLMEKRYAIDSLMKRREYLLKRMSNALVVLHLTKLNETDYGRYFRKRRAMLRPAADILVREKVDVIHAAFGDEPASTAMALSDLTGIPFTFECHAHDLFVYFPFHRDKFVKTSAIFTISDYNRRYLARKLGCPEDKIIIKRVPFNKDYCDALPDAPKDGNLIVSAARLHPTKGLDPAIRAFGLVSKRMEDLRYIIIGDGPLRKKLQGLINDLGLEGKVTLKGNLPNTEVLAYLKKAAIGMLPAMIADDGDRDGIPTAMIESMYLRTPVIGSKVSGIPELIEDGVDGILADPGDILLLSDQIEFLLSDRALREAMGQKAREKVVRMFNVDDNMDILVKGLESAIAH